MLIVFLRMFCIFNNIADEQILKTTIKSQGIVRFPLKITVRHSKRKLDTILPNTNYAAHHDFHSLI